jgi:hypothetical protein
VVGQCRLTFLRRQQRSRQAPAAIAAAEAQEQEQREEEDEETGPGRDAAASHQLLPLGRLVVGAWQRAAGL